MDFEFTPMRLTAEVPPWPATALAPGDLRRLAVCGLRLLLVRTEHGLQPYGRGAWSFADPAVESFYKHDSPYTYSTFGRTAVGAKSSWQCPCRAPVGGAVERNACFHWFEVAEFGRMLGAWTGAGALIARLQSDRRFVVGFPRWTSLFGFPKRPASARRPSVAAPTEAALWGLHLALATLPTRLRVACGNEG